jgi:hypothetical protein
LDNQRIAREEVAAQRAIQEAEILHSIGVTPAEASLFGVLHYGLTVPPDDLIRRATCDWYSVGGMSTQDQ